MLLNTKRTIDSDRCDQYSRCNDRLISIGREDLKSFGYAFLYKNRRMCPLHFEEYMFAGLSRSKLIRDAGPTIYGIKLDRKDYLQNNQKLLNQWRSRLIHVLTYTRMYRAPRPCPGERHRRAVLELRGHPYPPVAPDPSANRNLLHNVLLAEARRDYRGRKYAEVAARIGPDRAKTETVAQSGPVLAE